MAKRRLMPGEPRSHLAGAIAHVVRQSQFQFQGLGMDRKFVKQLQRSFEKRGGRFEIAPDTSSQAVRMLLEELLDCPDCRAAVLEACNADNRKDIDIDAVIRDLALRVH